MTHRPGNVYIPNDMDNWLLFDARQKGVTLGRYIGEVDNVECLTNVYDITAMKYLFNYA